MKKFLVVSAETLDKLINNFTDMEELESFTDNMADMAKELMFLNELHRRIPSPEEAKIVLMKQVALYTLFTREYIELVQSLMISCDVKMMDQDDVNKLQNKEPDA